MSNALQHARVNLSARERRFPRHAVKSLGCFCVAGDSIGIVLNVSEDGLGVSCTTVPSPQCFAPVKFQLPESPHWITTRGKIVWTNETKGEAGIQFIELSDSARMQIRNWISSQDHGNNSAVTSAVEQRPGLAAILPISANASSTGIGQLMLTAQSSTDNFDRTLRALFEQREAFAAATASTEKPTRWGLITLAGSLACLSFLIGLLAVRGKLLPLVGLFTKSAGNAAVSGPLVPQSSPLRANAAPPRATGPAQASAAKVKTHASAALVSVTGRLYVPASYVQDRPSKAKNLRLGEIKHRVDPEYPSQAISERIEGTVQLRATISAGGEVHSVSVVSGPPQLAMPALNAVRFWRYTPTLLDEKPVEAEADIAIVFSLPANSEGEPSQSKKSAQPQ